MSVSTADFKRPWSRPAGEIWSTSSASGPRETTNDRGPMSIRNCLSFAILWMGLAASAAAQTVSVTSDDGPTLDQTPLMTPAERNEALLRHTRAPERAVAVTFDDL